MIIRQLIYLDALARERHFRKAAEHCHVSQPTLSTAIAQLEEELGVLIVERGRRFEGLTKEGEIVLAHARRILAEADLMKASIAELPDGAADDCSHHRTLFVPLSGRVPDRPIVDLG